MYGGGFGLVWRHHASIQGLHSSSWEMVQSAEKIFCPSFSVTLLFASVYNTTLAFLFPTRSCSYLPCSCSSHVSLFRGFGWTPEIPHPPPHPSATGLKVMIFWTYVLQIVLGISILSCMTTRGNTELYSVSCCSNLMEKIFEMKKTWDDIITTNAYW